MHTTRYMAQLLKISVFLFVMGQGQMSWGGDSPCPEADVYQRAERFHGHTCTGLLIGVRLGLAAREALRDAGVEGTLKARFYNHACPVDGIQVAVGTTLGNKTLEVFDNNDNRLILSDKKGMHILEARLTTLADKKREASLELKKKIGTLSADSEKIQELKIELENIYTWFRTASDTEVVRVRRLKQMH